MVGQSTDRFVRFWRALAVPAIAYCALMALLAVRATGPSVWLWPAVVAGVLLHLAGVVGMWWFPPRAPERISPRPGPEAGTETQRRDARRALRAGRELDAEQRRLVAVEVAAGARVPVVASVAFAVLGPVLMTSSHTSRALPWLGVALAAVVVLILLGLFVQVRGVRTLHRAALRADALPRFQARDAPFLP